MLGKVKRRIMLNQNQFERDCQQFQELIDRGKELEKKVHSIKGYDFNESHRDEKEGFRWFIETRSFLSSLFGENFRDVRTFVGCFGKYHSENLMGQYGGDINFVKEDVTKGVGVLEGIYERFKKREIKRRSVIFIWLSKIYHEIKEWAKILTNIKLPFT